jgi:hypothetical protein
VSLRSTAALALALAGAACATLPVETRPAADLDWGAHSGVSVIEILTHDPQGELRQTKVWFVRVAGHAYLRTSNTRWLANIRRDPQVTVRVEGADYPQLAEVVENPQTRQAVEDAFSAKYGLQNRFVRLFRMRHPDLLRLLPR